METGSNASRPALRPVASAPEFIPGPFSSVQGVSPGKNSWAIRKAAEEHHKMRSNAFYQKEHQKDPPINAGHQYPSYSHTNLHVGKDEKVKTPADSQPPDTPVTTISYFIAADAKNAQDAADPAKMVAEFESLKLVPDGSENAQPTYRASVEDKREQQLNEVMRANHTDGSSGAAQGSATQVDSPIITRDFAKQSEKKSGKQRSPRKKVLGLSITIPNFRSSTVAVSDPVTPQANKLPPKAAQVLGTRSQTHGRRNSRFRKDWQAEGESSSVPSKPRNAKPFNDRSQKFNTSGDKGKGVVQRHSDQMDQPQSGRSYTMPNRHAQAITLLRSQSLKYINGATPPTPPAKNTPPKLASEGNQNEGPQSKIANELKEEQGASLKGSENSSPSKSGGYGHKDYVKVVRDARSVYSRRASVGEASIQNGGEAMPSDEQGQMSQSARWSDGQMDNFAAQHKLLPGSQLPPTFYSPSVYSTRFDTPSFRPSQNRDTSVYFVSTPSKYDPSAVRRFEPSHVPKSYLLGGNGAKVSDRAGQPSLDSVREPFAGGNRATPVTDPKGSGAMLIKSPDSSNDERNSGRQRDASASPDRSTANDHAVRGTSIDLNELLRSGHAKSTPADQTFFPRYPSAVPTPLYYHGLASAPPTSLSVGGPPDPANILTHFDVVHHHMDDATSSLHRSVTLSREDVIGAVLGKHEDSLKVLNEHFGDMRAQLNAVEHNMGRVSGECENGNTKIDKLADIIQRDVLELLQKVTDTNKELSAKIDAMGSRVRELEKKVEATQPRQTHPAPPAVTNNSSTAPTTHSPLPYTGTNVPWGGYPLSFHRHHLQQMDPHVRRLYLATQGQQVGAPDISHHPAYATQGNNGYADSTFGYSNK